MTIRKAVQCVVAMVGAFLFVPGTASAATLRSSSFGWQGAPVAGDANAEVTYSAAMFVPPNWRRVSSEADPLRFRTWAPRGRDRCQLDMRVRASFLVGTSVTAADALAAQFPVRPGLILGVGTRDASAWQVWKRPQSKPDSPVRFQAVWQTAISTATAPQVIWGRVSLSAVSLPGKSVCTTSFYRDGPFRAELNDALATTRLSASY